MIKNIIKLIPLVFLTACTTVGDINEPPLATSRDSAANVRINKVIAADNVTFTINDVEIYGFGEASDYEFVTDAGSYMFGYKKGFKKCYAAVMLNAGVSYVFELKPDCIIEMQ